MALARVLFVFGLTMSLAAGSSDSECGSFATVTVTVAPQATVTVMNSANAPLLLTSSALASRNALVADSTSLQPTTTLSSTDFVTSTVVVNVDNTPVPLPAQSGSAGYYYYAEVDGTTTWLGGKTPTSGAALVTNTVVVTVKPQPISIGTATVITASQGTSTSEDGTSTSTTTLSSTSYYTQYLTKDLTLQSTPTSMPASRLSPYVGPSGWNATLSGADRLKDNAPVPSHPTLPASGTVLATAPVAFKRRHPRQIGAVVSATINGVVVSWTNSYGGEPAPSNVISAIPVSSSNLAVTTSEPLSTSVYMWQPSLEPSTGQVETSVPQQSSLSQPSSQAAPRPSSILASRPQQSSASPTNEVLSTQLPTESSIPTLSIVKPSPPFSNATQTSSATLNTPSSSCDTDTGLFTINFDDLPHFSTSTPLSDIPPIFNPYQKLFFNGGYGYVPPPEDPYAPVSPPQLAVYNYHNDSVSQTAIDAGLELHGEIGAGPRVKESAYWIDAYSTWIGCANGGPSECRIDFIGYDQFDTEIATQTLLQPPCPGLVNCKLAQVAFTNQFRDLAGLQILAYVNKTPVTFYMDDLSLGWSNNTCAAQFERAAGE